MARERPDRNLRPHWLVNLIRRPRRCSNGRQLRHILGHRIVEADGPILQQQFQDGHGLGDAADPVHRVRIDLGGAPRRDVARGGRVVVLEHGGVGGLMDGEEVQGEGGGARVETEGSVPEALGEAGGEAGGYCTDGEIGGEGGGGIEDRA